MYVHKFTAYSIYDCSSDHSYHKRLWRELSCLYDDYQGRMRPRTVPKDCAADCTWKVSELILLCVIVRDQLRGARLRSPCEFEFKIKARKKIIRVGLWPCLRSDPCPLLRVHIRGILTASVGWQVVNWWLSFCPCESFFRIGETVNTNWSVFYLKKTCSSVCQKFCGRGFSASRSLLDYYH